MKLNRICLLLAASLVTLFSSGQLAAQSSAPITLVKANRLLAASAAPGDTIYAHPGRVVSTADGARLNFICMGAGSPAVVFESAFGDWAPAWAVVLPRIAAWTRACVYDHAGAGFSDPGPIPRTNVRIANELHQALRNAGIAGPCVLVGNASGGYPARTFAQLYMAETAGLVLVEVDASDLEPKALQEEDHAGNATGIAALRKCRDAVAAGGGHCRRHSRTRIGHAPSFSSFAGCPNLSFRLN